MKKLATPLSQKEAETIRRLSIETRRLAHRLKAEKAKFLSRENVNCSISLATRKLREIFGPKLASELANKIAGLSAGQASRICREEETECYVRFRNWIEEQLAAKPDEAEPVAPRVVVPFRKVAA